MPKLTIISFLLVLVFSTSIDIHSQDEKTYCTSWSSSQYLTEEVNMPEVPLSSNSLRQIVHVSIGGELVRIKFSNRYGKSDLVIKAARIANSVRQGSGEIDPDTDTPITFGGEKGITIPPGGETYCDTFTYSLRDQSEVAVSIYFGDVPNELTGHAGSRTHSFIGSGNTIRDTKFSLKFRVTHWYILSAIEISSNPPLKTIVCYGDSITDGRGSTDDKQNRWTDHLAFQLSTHRATNNIGVVNAGIGATLVTTSGLERYTRDVLAVKGAAYVIVLYGINDIIFLNATAKEVTDAYKTLIKKGHKANKLVYGGTILPFKNSIFYSEEREEVRREVNDWIRKAKPKDGGFDKFFDFDQILRDPIDNSALDEYYDCGDGLHPSPEGYEMMVYAMDDLSVFLVEPNFNILDLITPLIIENIPGVKIRLETTIRNEIDFEVIIIGSCKGSKGFRIWALNDKEERTSNYYKTGPIEEGMFELTAKLSTVGTSTDILIKGPMSTIDIDSITINVIAVKVNGVKTIYDPIEAIPYEN